MKGRTVHDGHTKKIDNEPNVLVLGIRHIVNYLLDVIFPTPVSSQLKLALLLHHQGNTNQAEDTNKTNLGFNLESTTFGRSFRAR